jgi:hypothetical protein
MTPCAGRRSTKKHAFHKKNFQIFARLKTFVLSLHRISQEM